MGKRGVKRIGKNKPQRLRFLIVSEGAVTERDYFDAVKRSATKRSQMKLGENIVFVPPGPTSPIEMVKKAHELWIKSRQEDDEYDAVWCVFDVEAKVNQTARPGLADALQMVKTRKYKKISIALSNPCFELWVLLHYENCNAWTYSDDVQHRCSELRLVDEKHIQNPDELLKKYPPARRRAENLDAQHQRNGTIKEADQNPSSGVYKLIDAIYAAFPART